MSFGTGAILAFFALLFFAIVSIVRTARRLGPATRPTEALKNAKVILHLRQGEPDARWQKLGKATTADGLNLLFEADDDPAAEAQLYLPSVDPSALRMTESNNQYITLPADFQTVHAASGRYACLVKLRGAPEVVGRAIKLNMTVDGKGRPVGAGIENEDSRSPAVGGWIEIESLAILELR